MIKCTFDPLKEIPFKPFVFPEPKRQRFRVFKNPTRIEYYLVNDRAISLGLGCIYIPGPTDGYFTFKRHNKLVQVYNTDTKRYEL